MKTIRLIRLFNGEMLLGEVEDCEDVAGGQGMVDIANPRLMLSAATMGGGVQFIITDVTSPLKSDGLNKSISIPRTQVMFGLFENEIDKEIVNAYKSEVSGIEVASASDLNILGSATNKGAFTL